MKTLFIIFGVSLLVLFCSCSIPDISVSDVTEKPSETYDGADLSMYEVKWVGDVIPVRSSLSTDQPKDKRICFNGNWYSLTYVDQYYPVSGVLADRFRSSDGVEICFYAGTDRICELGYSSGDPWVSCPDPITWEMDSLEEAYVEGWLVPTLKNLFGDVFLANSYECTYLVDSNLNQLCPTFSFRDVPVDGYKTCDGATIRVDASGNILSVVCIDTGVEAADPEITLSREDVLEIFRVYLQSETPDIKRDPVLMSDITLILYKQTPYVCFSGSLEEGYIGTTYLIDVSSVSQKHSG